MTTATTSNQLYVVDTNVMISAILSSEAIAGLAFKKAYFSGKTLSSTATLEELKKVVLRSKFNKYSSLEDRLETLLEFTKDTLIVEITETITDCRDPKDNKFLELAVCGKASAIITGDDDLLVLHPYRGISILTPRAFLEQAL